MTPIEQLHRAEAAARIAEKIYWTAQTEENAVYVVATLCNLLAALDAARGEAVVTVNRYMLAQLGPDRWIPATRPECPLASTDVALFAAPVPEPSMDFERLPVNETEAEAMGLSYAAPPAALAVPGIDAEALRKELKEAGVFSPMNACCFRDQCRALAQQPAAAVPEGYALVPVEPTREMIEAGILFGNSPNKAAIIWQNMLAAAARKGE